MLMLKDMIINKASLEKITDPEKNFHVQTLLRRYAPCKHNSIDEVLGARYLNQGLIKSVQFTNLNKLRYLITSIFYENELK